jgi:glycerophosphoryl diester phosphodiesterase
MLVLKRGASARRPPSPGLDRSVFVRPIAHRGLHDAAQGRPENTEPAFLAAVRKSYGIECDLQSAADGTPMVFHDETLDRLVAASGRIAAFSPAALSRLRYKGLNQKILSFAAFLDLVDRRVPLLVEIKNKSQRLNAPFLEEIARQAIAYKGPIALMSFNSTVVAALAELAPKVPRGLIVGGQQVVAKLWVGATRGRGDVVARELALGAGGVAFYAVDVKLVAGARKWLARQALDLPLFTWTVRTPRQRAAAARWADAPIFEGYEP